jgi:hypothetical protein
MAEDVALLHPGHEVMVQMQVGSAYGTTGDLDDGVKRIFDFWIGNGIASNVFLAVPNESFHLHTSGVVTLPLQSRCPRGAGHDLGTMASNPSHTSRGASCGNCVQTSVTMAQPPGRMIFCVNPRP